MTGSLLKEAVINSLNPYLYYMGLFDILFEFLLPLTEDLATVFGLYVSDQAGVQNNILLIYGIAKLKIPM